MLNEERVRLMTNLARYENGEGKKYLPISKYYRSDYIGLALIKNFFMVTIAYILLIALVCGFYMDELLNNIHKMDLIQLGAQIIFGYVALILFYSFVVYVIQSVKYRRAKKSLRGYYIQLGKVAQTYGGKEKKNKPAGRRD